jgi:hypothetical protein
MDKSGSKVHRVHMELGGKLLNSLRIKTQFLRFQSVRVIDSATHSQKDCMEGNRGYLAVGAEAFVLFLRGAQLVLRSSVLTVLGLDEVNVTL